MNVVVRVSNIYGWLGHRLWISMQNNIHKKNKQISYFFDDRFLSFQDY